VVSLLSTAGTSHNLSPTGRGIVCVVTSIGLASPPAPLRMERGVVCEVTPISLLIEREGTLNVRRICRGNLGNHFPLHSERNRGVRLLMGVGYWVLGVDD